MRDAVDRILAWHKPFRGPGMLEKAANLAESPFRFFRATHFLYVSDVLRGSFRQPAMEERAGPIVGDIHIENYGTFRAVSGDIVYDINDFDDATIAPYEYDARRLAVSLILAALDMRLRLGDGLNAAEHALRSWTAQLARVREKDRGRIVGNLLDSVKEIKRSKFLASKVEQTPRGTFAIRESEKHLPVSAAERASIEAAVPLYWQNCLAPSNAKTKDYILQDVKARIAGSGSLGRLRYALLFDKGTRKEASLETLRFIEWKQAFDSPLDRYYARASKGRAQKVFDITSRMQPDPKRYLGFTLAGGVEMQAREIGANDARFSHDQLKEKDGLEKAAEVFGRILARCHLRAADAPIGQIDTPEDRYVNRLLRFAADYCGQVHRDHEAFLARQEEVTGKWKT